MAQACLFQNAIEIDYKNILKYLINKTPFLKNLLFLITMGNLVFSY